MKRYYNKQVYKGELTMKKILNKTIDDWIKTYPIVSDLMHYKTCTWFNPNYNYFREAEKKLNFDISDMIDADARLRRFAPFLAHVFEEVKDSKGIIESPLLPIRNMSNYLNIEENVLLKCDNALPISGSIKARGGIYEILRYAENLLVSNNLLKVTDDYKILASEAFKKFFSNYEIVVSSTGNLGLSIGIISAKIGFTVHVHMSSDAQKWKKDKLRSLNVNVIEHDSDYSKAVEIGRAASLKKSNSYFVDDENSLTLFMGYAVAAFRLVEQLENMSIQVTKDKPLFVYLPCGVGGGPGGIAYGLKQLLKERVHCFFVEPTHSPCMLLGMATGAHNKVCVQDFGMDNITAADGLAVGRASEFVGKVMTEVLAGIMTVEDASLFKYLKALVDCEKIYLEPSALAGFKGLEEITNLESSIINRISITKDQIKAGVHVVWSTGGDMVPEAIMNQYYHQKK